MYDCVSRSEIMKKLQYNGDPGHDYIISEVRDMVRNQPELRKIQSVVHAHWELMQELPFCDEYACTRCGRSISLNPGRNLRDFPFCHCGAKMDEEIQNE